MFGHDDFPRRYTDADVQAAKENMRFNLVVTLGGLVLVAVLTHFHEEIEHLLGFSENTSVEKESVEK